VAPSRWSPLDLQEADALKRFQAKACACLPPARLHRGVAFSKHERRSVMPDPPAAMSGLFARRAAAYRAIQQRPDGGIVVRDRRCRHWRAAQPAISTKCGPVHILGLSGVIDDHATEEANGLGISRNRNEF
jgi:hypothetical protein